MALPKGLGVDDPTPLGINTDELRACIAENRIGAALFGEVQGTRQCY